MGAKLIERWIMVAGAPRSGTTFVGQVLSAPFAVDYVHEPFNPACGMPGLTQRYLYVRRGGGEAERLRPLVSDLLAFRTTLRTGYYRNDTAWRAAAKRVVGSRGPLHYRLGKLNPFSRTAVLKEPVGCLLAEFLAEEFAVAPVILVRHPVAFVASTLRLGWTWELDPRHFAEQPELMQDYFNDEKELFSREWREPIDRAAICWNVLNKVLLTQAERHPEWPVLRHEDVSRDPLGHFRDLYLRFHLPWTRRLERRIRRMTSENNPVTSSSGRVQAFRRNSGELFSFAIRRLTVEQRARVYEFTKDVAARLYPKSTFALSDSSDIQAGGV